MVAAVRVRRSAAATVSFGFRSAAVVHLSAPANRLDAGGIQSGPAIGRHDEVRLAVPYQGLDRALRLQIRGDTEIWPKAVIRREPNVVEVRAHHIGDGAGFEASHPVGEHHSRYAAHFLEALAQ